MPSVPVSQQPAAVIMEQRFCWHTGISDMMFSPSFDLQILLMPCSLVFDGLLFSEQRVIFFSKSLWGFLFWTMLCWIESQKPEFVFPPGKTWNQIFVSTQCILMVPSFFSLLFFDIFGCCLVFCFVSKNTNGLFENLLKNIIKSSHCSLIQWWHPFTGLCMW